MKKIIKKLGLSLLVINFSFLAFGSNAEKVDISYAAEEDAIYEKQKSELAYAVSDRANVVSTQAYTEYASADQKAAYENAIAQGNAVLAKGNNATREEMATATSNINKAKASITRSVTRAVEISKLRAAVDRNQKTTDAANLLLNKYPHTVKNIRPQLIDLINKSQNLINKAQQILQAM